MNRQTKALRKLGLCSIASHAQTKEAKLRNPTIQAVEHGKHAFEPPDVAKKRKAERKRY
jgi:hypothetical protein